jgi:hypothetical protein
VTGVTPAALKRVEKKSGRELGSRSQDICQWIVNVTWLAKRENVGAEAPNLSPTVISRLTAEWREEYTHWQKRDLSARHYVYAWADGVYLQARMEEHTDCMLVLLGAMPEGKKELIGFQVGVRESAQSWRELLVDLKSRAPSIGSTCARRTPLKASSRRFGTGQCARRGRSRQPPPS